MAEQPHAHTVTLLLGEVRTGSPEALDQLTRRVYLEMRALAAHFMNSERADHILQPTALLHEAWLRLTQGDYLGHLTNHQALVGGVCRVMREVLVDHARRRRTLRRGHSWTRTALDQIVDGFAALRVDLIDLDDALVVLAVEHPRQASVVTLRFLSGLTVQEVAVELAISVSTVEEDFRFARAWLHKQLRGSS